MKAAMEIFKDITGYDIKSYFEDFVLLCNTYYPNIVGYYMGQNIDVRDSFGRLDALLKQSEAIEPLFYLKASGFSTLDSWEFLTCLRTAKQNYGRLIIPLVGFAQPF